MSNITEPVARFLGEHGPAYGFQFLSALLIGLIGWLLSAWVSRGIHSISQHSRRIDRTLAPLLVKLARWSILGITLVAVLDKFGVETTSVIAFLGAAGLAIGLALKDTVSDVAAGVVLLVLRPFDVGDAVNVAGAGGVVDAIDLFQTTLISWDGVPVVLPNSKVRTAEIQNYSRAKRRRIDLIVGISYADDIQRAVDALEALARRDPRVLPEPEFMIKVNELSDSSVNLLLRVWTTGDEYWAVKFDMTRAIKDSLDGAGITIPFPQRDVHLFQAGKGSPEL
jgi:small conductance mechanosensitive channel